MEAFSWQENYNYTTNIITCAQADQVVHGKKHHYLKGVFEDLYTWGIIENL